MTKPGQNLAGKRNEWQIWLFPRNLHRIMMTIYSQVFDDQTGAEPGWKGGEKNGKSGWFPEAYVEKIQESSQTVFGAELR